MKTIGALKKGRLRAAASGVLPNGKPVVVNADGTVSVASGNTIPSSSEFIFNNADTVQPRVAFDLNNANKFVCTYKDEGNSNYGTAVVGTISGTSISFGSEVVFNSATTNPKAVEFDPNNGNICIVAWSDNSNGEIQVGTVSGTSISFGSAQRFNSGNATTIDVSFDPNTANKFVVFYRDYANSDNGVALIGTRSGDSISYGSKATFTTNSIDYPNVSYDPNTANKFVGVYRDGGNSNYGTSIAGSVSGTSISFGSAVVFNSGQTNDGVISFDPNTANKYVIAYDDGGDSNKGKAIVGTISGTSLSYGTESQYSAGTSINDVAFNPNKANQFVVAYKDSSSPFYGFVVVGTVSGTSISYSSPIQLQAGRSDDPKISFDPNTAGRFIVSYIDAGNSNKGTVILGDVGSAPLTSENYIGMSSGGQVASGSSATVDIVGTVNADQSSLTAGQQYFVQTDGTIGLTADDPSVFAGTAISSTKLLVKS